MASVVRHSYRRMSRKGVKNLALLRTLGAPYLARFSRDVGFYCTATGIRPGGKGATNGRPPHLAKNVRDMGHPASWQDLFIAASTRICVTHYRWMGRRPMGTFEKHLH